MKLQSILLIFAISTFSAVTVTYVNNNLSNETTKLAQEDINKSISRYVEQNASSVLEQIAKEEKFALTIKNIAQLDDENIKNSTIDVLNNNPELLKNYISNNVEVIADIIVNSDSFKNAQVSVEPEETNNAEEDKNSEETSIYKKHWKEILNHEDMASVGPKNAKVTVVEFFDFACGHCKALSPLMARLMQDNPDVRFMFAPLFYVSSQSPYAAKMALAAAKKGAFDKVYEGILTLPELNEESVNQIIVDEGLSLDEIKELAETKDIRRGIQNIDSLSQVLDINGVPFILINGEPVFEKTYEDWKNKINSFK